MRTHVGLYLLNAASIIEIIPCFPPDIRLKNT